MLKCDFSKVTKQLYCNFIEITLQHGCCPINLLDIFRTPFLKNSSGGLLLGNEFAALLTDLFKAFDYIDHKLLIAKLFWHGVSPTALNLIHSYLTNKTQRVKINASFSRRSNIEYVVC